MPRIGLQWHIELTASTINERQHELTPTHISVYICTAFIRVSLSYSKVYVRLCIASEVLRSIYRFPKPMKLSLTGTFPSIGLLYLLLTVV